MTQEFGLNHYHPMLNVAVPDLEQFATADTRTDPRNVSATIINEETDHLDTRVEVVQVPIISVEPSTVAGNVCHNRVCFDRTNKLERADREAMG